MRTCSGCQSGVPDESESCPRCGNPAPRGFLASFLGLFRARPALPKSGAPAPSAPGPRDLAGAFSFKVEDVFSITRRGTVITGRVASGEIHVGDEVRFRSARGASVQCRVTGVEMLGKILDAARAGDHAGLLLSKVKPGDIEVGTVVERA